MIVQCRAVVVDRTDTKAAAAGKTTIAILHAHQIDRTWTCGTGPGHATRWQDCRETFSPSRHRPDCTRLGKIVMGILVMPNADAALPPSILLLFAELEPFLDDLVFVLTRLTCKRWPPPSVPPAAGAPFVEPISYTSVWSGRILEIFFRFVDHVLGNRNAGVAAGPERLQLGNRHGPFSSSRPPRHGRCKSSPPLVD